MTPKGTTVSGFPSVIAVLLSSLLGLSTLTGCAAAMDQAESLAKSLGLKPSDAPATEQRQADRSRTASTVNGTRPSPRAAATPREQDPALVNPVQPVISIEPVSVTAIAAIDEGRLNEYSEISIDGRSETFVVRRWQTKDVVSSSDGRRVALIIESPRKDRSRFVLDSGRQQGPYGTVFDLRFDEQGRLHYRATRIEGSQRRRTKYLQVVDGREEEVEFWGTGINEDVAFDPSMPPDGVSSAEIYLNDRLLKTSHPRITGTRARGLKVLWNSYESPTVDAIVQRPVYSRDGSTMAFVGVQGLFESDHAAATNTLYVSDGRAVRLGSSQVGVADLGLTVDGQQAVMLFYRPSDTRSRYTRVDHTELFANADFAPPTTIFSRAHWNLLLVDGQFVDLYGGLPGDERVDVSAVSVSGDSRYVAYWLRSRTPLLDPEKGPGPWVLHVNGVPIFVDDKVLPRPTNRGTSGLISVSIDPEPNAWPGWFAADGRTLCYLRNRDGQIEVVRIDLEDAVARIGK